MCSNFLPHRWRDHVLERCALIADQITRCPNSDLSKRKLLGALTIAAAQRLGGETFKSSTIRNCAISSAPLLQVGSSP
jgi:hypothetical protein